MKRDALLPSESLSAPEGALHLRRFERVALARWVGPLWVILLTLGFGLINWAWLNNNVVTYGWDRMDHLISSLAYNDMLRTVTPTSLFTALTWSDYYPPLVHLVAVTAYKLFGVSEDVAVMPNVFYLGLLLGATWSIARRASHSQGVALLATLIMGTFPMIYTMSRYLYLDFALTCTVATTLALLLASERFTRRGPSLLLGVALGATFLVKWTAAAFLAVPLALILWRSGVLLTLWRQPMLLRPGWLRLGVALAGGAVLAFGWIWPAQDIAVAQSVGLSLIPLLALAFGGGLYVLMPRRGQGSSAGGQPTPVAVVQNALNAGALAFLTLSLWYLPNINFLQGFYINAYGKPTGRSWAYDKYIDYVVTEQLGPLYTLVLGLVVAGWLWGWLGRVREGQRPAQGGVADTTLVLGVWALVPFLIFSSKVSTVHSRYLMPFLPPFAVWLALGLWRVRPVWGRVGALTLVLGLAWAQFAIISFDRFDGWRERFWVALPGGPVNLLAHGFSIQYPATGVTDPRFAITPEILTILEQARQEAGRERVTLGLVVNAYQLHEKHFLYEIYTQFPKVFLRELARNWTGRPTYPQLFEMDYVLLDDTHSYRTADESQQVTQRILTHPDDLFNLAFREVRRWELPSTETIILYERRFAETKPGILPENYHALIQQFGAEFGAGDAVVLTAPDQAYIMGLLLPQETGARVVPLPADGQDSSEALHTLEALARTHQRIFLLSRNSTVADPAGQLEGWLRANTIPGAEQWVNDVRVALFVPGRPAEHPTQPVQATFEADELRLAGVALPSQGEGRGATLQPGGALPLTLFWEGVSAADELKVFLQLLGPDGTLVAQRDTTLVAGPQSHALLIPRNAVPGSYRLIAGLYRASDGQRLPVTQEGRALPDHAVPLGTFQLIAPRGQE